VFLVPPHSQFKGTLSLSRAGLSAKIAYLHHPGVALIKPAKWGPKPSKPEQREASQPGDRRENSTLYFIL
jgi:hypothetical protein